MNKLDTISFGFPLRQAALMALDVQNDDAELTALGEKLKEAIAIYRAMVSAIPAEASVEAEHAAIEAASGPVFALADQIADMTATSDEGIAVKARAHAFLAGCLDS